MQLMIKELNSNVLAKPFLKLAGGKTQLLVELEKRIPIKIKNSGNINQYIEPFIGGGAFFFFLKKEKEVQTIATIPYAKTA